MAGVVMEIPRNVYVLLIFLEYVVKLVIRKVSSSPLHSFFPFPFLSLPFQIRIVCFRKRCLGILKFSFFIVLNYFSQVSLAWFFVNSDYPSIFVFQVKVVMLSKTKVLIKEMANTWLTLMAEVMTMLSKFMIWHRLLVVGPCVIPQITKLILREKFPPKLLLVLMDIEQIVTTYR